MLIVLNGKHKIQNYNNSIEKCIETKKRQEKEKLAFNCYLQIVCYLCSSPGLKV